MKRIVSIFICYLLVISSPLFAQTPPDDLEIAARNLHSPYLFLRRDQQGRVGNRFEYSYMIMAEELNLPQFCEIISPTAYFLAEYNYVRSACFYRIAIINGDVDYCSKVKKLELPDYLHPIQYNHLEESMCQREVQEGKKDLIKMYFGERGYSLVKIFMGYEGAYKELPETVDFDIMFSRLPDFSIAGAPLSDSEETAQRLGCYGENELQWDCRAVECLSNDSEVYRELCLKVVEQLIKVDSMASQDKSFPYKLPDNEQTIYKAYSELREMFNESYNHYMGWDFQGFWKNP